MATYTVTKTAGNGPAETIEADTMEVNSRGDLMLIELSDSLERVVAAYPMGKWDSAVAAPPAVS